MEQVGIIHGIDSPEFLRSYLMFTAKEEDGEGDAVYFYLIEKGYLYKSYIDVVGATVKYVEPGADEEGEVILEEILKLKKHLENKFLNKKVEDMRAKYEVNGLEEYILDGYEMELVEINFGDDEIQVRTNDLFPPVSVTVFSEDGITYSFVSTETGY